MSEKLPLVSCIMPTKGRPEFMRRALGLFEAQEYPNKELVIVDEYRTMIFKPPSTKQMMAELHNISSIGAKRNHACKQANGDLVAHWDDDDWHHPMRLSTQIGMLLAQDADLCGADRVVFHDTQADRAWLFKSVRNPWLCGGTLVYKKSLWEKNPFLDVSDGEDVAFVDAAYKSGTVAVLTDPSFYVATIHGGNTTKRNVNSQWGHFDVATVKEWMKDQNHCAPVGPPSADLLPHRCS